MLCNGDTLVVWRLDRLERSPKHLIELIAKLEQREIGFKRLMESMDTITSGGKLEQLDLKASIIAVLI